MTKLRLYKVDINYIKYLYNYDAKVQYNSKKDVEYNQKRPYLGVVLNINNLNYFVPLEHPRQGHLNLKNNDFIYKIHNGKYGILGINNMIPIPKESLIEFDINNEKEEYRHILISQYRFCNKHIDDILYKARCTYEKRVNNKNKFFNKVCCDFKLLEQKCLKYKDD